MSNEYQIYKVNILELKNRNYGTVINSTVLDILEIKRKILTY